KGTYALAQAAFDHQALGGWQLDTHLAADKVGNAFEIAQREMIVVGGLDARDGVAGGLRQVWSPVGKGTRWRAIACRRLSGGLGHRIDTAEQTLEVEDGYETAIAAPESGNAPARPGPPDRRGWIEFGLIQYSHLEHAVGT